MHVSGPSAARHLHELAPRIGGQSQTSAERGHIVSGEAEVRQMGLHLARGPREGHERGERQHTDAGSEHDC